MLHMYVNYVYHMPKWYHSFNNSIDFQNLSHFRIVCQIFFYCSTSLIPHISFLRTKMSTVWKRLQRANKSAAKFQFIASYQELIVEGTSKW